MALSQVQVGSAGAYAFINNAVYLEASAYHTLSPNTLNNLGADPFDAPGQARLVALLARSVTNPIGVTTGSR